MSFIAALILMIFDNDEALAWTVFMKLLSERSDWRRFYGENTPKLFEFTKQLREFVKNDLPPRLNRVLNEHNVVLESLLASPLLTIFSNLIPVDHALRVLERFMLGKLWILLTFCTDGEKTIMDVMKHLLRRHEAEISNMDCWDIQVFLGRKIYENAIEDNSFFPPIKFA